METGHRTARLYGLAAVAALAFLWKLAAAGVGKDIILPAPERVAAAFFELLGSRKFLDALAATALRGLAAFAVSMALGGAAGFASGMSRRFEAVLEPFLTVIKATPILAVILVALIWFPSKVPVFSAVVMAFPVVCVAVAEGVRSADPRLMAMARSFGVPRREQFIGIRLPASMPYLVAAARGALGLCWKAVVAGEVLSQPIHALGTGMSEARNNLETTSLFAWAAAGVLLCALSDALFALASRRLSWPTK